MQSDAVSVIAHRLEADGQAVSSAQLPGATVLVGYRGDFRLRWMATKLHLFTVALAVPSVTAAELNRFAEDALEFAIRTRGGARGFQVGVAAIPILVADHVDASAAQFARDHIVKKWAAFAWPAVLDRMTGTIHRHEGAVIIGGVYAGWMRNQTRVALGG